MTSSVDSKAALVVAHPGHELRIHRWLELARPTVFVITDGSGRTGRSRLPSTTKVLERAGATPGSVYGVSTDADLYSIMLAGDVGFARGLTATIVDALIALEVDTVVADALEGFNPSHDLCRYIVNAAVERIRHDTGRVLRNFDFLLDGNPLDDTGSTGTLRIELDDADLERKLAAADGYPELWHERDAAIQRFGTAPFRAELLRPVVDPRQGLDGMPEDPPYYERFGEQQVRAGHYKDLIRYREHLQPLARSLSAP